MMKNEIEQWVLSVYQNKDLKFDDLHINEIYSSFSDQDQWIMGTEICLKAVTDILEENKLPLKILAAISLCSDKEPIGVNFSTVEQIEKEFDSTPPSLYAFSEDYNWAELENNLIKVNIHEFNSKNINCFYLEYKEPDEEEYRRSLWLEQKI